MVALSWNYNVIHLWRMSAEELLALNRRSLLPLVGLTRLQNPAETLPQVVAEIRAEPDGERQTLLLRQLIDLLQDEELSSMTEQRLTDEDLEELKRFPALWRDYQRIQQEAQTMQARKYILETLVTRFDPPVSDYRRVEEVISTVTDTDRLNALFRHALLATDLAEFAREALGESAS
jgi:hypothetical protein